MYKIRYIQVYAYTYHILVHTYILYNTYKTKKKNIYVCKKLYNQTNTVFVQIVPNYKLCTLQIGTVQGRSIASTRPYKKCVHRADVRIHCVQYA